MPITVVEAETLLADRTGQLLTNIGKDLHLSAGIGTPTFRNALMEGLFSLKLTPATFGQITDADLAQVPDNRVPQLLDIGQLALLTDVYITFRNANSITVGKVSKTTASNSVAGIADVISQLTAKVKALYGYGVSNITGGKIRLRFSGASSCDETTAWRGSW